MMRNLWFWFSSSLFLAATLPVTGATFLERSISHTVEASGEVRESVRLRVRLDSEKDVKDWSPYYVYLDENRKLVSLEAGVIYPNGGFRKVRRKDQDTLEVAGADVLHGSQKFQEVEFPRLSVDSILKIQYEVAVQPYFPSGTIHLASDDTIAKLDVKVRSANGPLTWHLEADAELYKVEADESSVRVITEGRDPLDTPKGTPGDVASGPVLRYSWGGARDWSEVGRWFEEILHPVPRFGETARAKARSLLVNIQDPREQLDVLTEFVQKEVRYVAVEVGIGGYRPSSPAETLDRKWGDCKDKSLLLIDLLKESKIPAFPALIRASQSSQIESEFPSPMQFNHLIVAVPRDAVPGRETDPDEGSFLFIDPTLTQGKSSWIHPSTQGQKVLVVQGGESELVDTPLAPQLERRQLNVNLSIQPDGSASGGIGLTLSGSRAANLRHAMVTEPPEEFESLVRAVLSGLLPGSKVEKVGWSEGDSPWPTINIAGALQLTNLVQGTPDKYSLRLPAARATPKLQSLDERTEPVALSPGDLEVVWKIHLPEPWCRPKASETVAENSLGSFEQIVEATETGAIVRRHTSLLSRRVEPEELPLLEELMLAETRALKRRLRARCEAEPAGQ